MGRAMRKGVWVDMWTAKAQISLRIRSLIRAFTVRWQKQWILRNVWMRAKTPGLYFAHAQDNLNLLLLRMLESTFSAWHGPYIITACNNDKKFSCLTRQRLRAKLTNSYNRASFSTKTSDRTMRLTIRRNDRLLILSYCLIFHRKYGLFERETIRLEDQVTYFQGKERKKQTNKERNFEVPGWLDKPSDFAAILQREITFANCSIFWAISPRFVYPFLVNSAGRL